MSPIEAKHASALACTRSTVSACYVHQHHEGLTQDLADMSNLTPCRGVEVEVCKARLGLARVSVVRGEGPHAGTPAIDDYICSLESITDYLTKWSGLVCSLDAHLTPVAQHCPHPACPLTDLCCTLSSCWTPFAQHKGDLCSAAGVQHPANVQQRPVKGQVGCGQCLVTGLC